MAKRRTTYGKLERDRAKRAKAAAKRERREGRAPEGLMGLELDEAEPAEAPAARPSLPQEEVLARLADAHQRFEAGELSFEDFEEEKAALLELIEVS